MSTPRLKKPRSGLGPRNVVMPVAAFVMAGILYMYSVTSIRAAKRNAQLHREADGGQLDMRKESLRRHGVLDRVEGTKGLQLFRDARASDAKNESDYLTEKKARDLGSVLQEDSSPGLSPSEQQKQQQQIGPRTEVEGALEGLKGTGAGAAVRKLREGLGSGSKKE